MRSLWHRILSPVVREADDLNKAAWLETLVVSWVAMTIAWWVRPDDPFLLEESFPWLLIAPLFLALRHGFMFGFLSVLGLIGMIIIAWRLGWAGDFDFPSTFVLGSLIVIMLTGEFSDYWRRRLGSVVVESEQRMQRMEAFTRAYHLLKVSHDQLVEQMAGSAMSLRQAMVAVRDQVLTKHESKDPMVSEAQNIMNLFRSYASVQAASLYDVRSGKLKTEPLAVIGAVPEVGEMLHGSDIVQEALQSGKMMSVLAADHGMPNYVDGNILAVVPICDLHAQTRALLVIYRIPFLKFNVDNLSLIALMGGYLGDLLHELEVELQGESAAKDEFLLELERNIHYARQYGMHAHLVTIELPCVEDAVEQLLSLRRSLDKTCVYKNKQDKPVVLWLMPFTDAYGVAGFQARIHLWAQQNFSIAGEKNPIDIQTFPIAGGESLDVLMHQVAHVCDLADT